MATVTTAAGAQVEAPAFAWDEPTGCSPRGWLAFTAGHPDREHRNFGVFKGELLTCGYYLDYSDDPGRAGKPAVLARAYCSRIRGGTDDLGCVWAETVEEAKRFIEGNVRAYLGLPRE